MLEYYFKSPIRIRQLRCGPIAPYLDGLAARLHQRGYCYGQAHTILGLAGDFSRYLSLIGIGDVHKITEDLAHRFSGDFASHGDYEKTGNMLTHLLNHLRDEGIVPVLEQESSADDPFTDIISRYEDYLANVRGVVVKTRIYSRSARRFLDFHLRRHGCLDLRKVDGPQILDYIAYWANVSQSRTWGQMLTTCTRSFLRFLRWESIVEQDLDRVVPSIFRYRLDTIPKHLPWQQVRALIDGMETLSPRGRRDKAILLLLATLGLRCMDVRDLQLDNIIWRKSEIHLPKTKSMRARVLPLTQEVGDALTDYVIHGRPAHNSRYVFLTHNAPIVPISCEAVTAIVSRNIKRAGIPAPHYGAHMLRHSLAAKMVNESRPIKEIADMLGHVSIDTTAIYAKVDTTHLATVALPFPGGAR
ncbi:MAG: tyrosine-type recombinase/integrase [Armatimonadota bacterium]